MIERMESVFAVTPDPFAQLQAKLRAGDGNGEGYIFDHYSIPEAHLEVDRLHYPTNGAVNIVLRQATLAPKQLFVTMPFEGKGLSPAPLTGDIVADLVAACPEDPLRIERENGFSTVRKASWSFRPSGRISWNMPDFDSGHGPITQETLRRHLGWILGSAALLSTTPPRHLSPKAS